MGIVLDDSDNVYIDGYTLSTSGIATKGAYQTTWVGDYDVFAAKFNSAGSKLLWGTYYGGRDGDFAWDIKIDHTRNIYITGWTNSASGIATAGAYQTIGDSVTGDAFVAKFNSTGTMLLWGTYYGGTAGTISYAIALDDSGNAYITGRTICASGIATPGAYQTVYGTNEDAFVAKFDSSGSKLMWGTYYGGTGDDFGEGIIIDDSNNVYITGATSSSSGIATLKAYQTSYGGGSGNAFVAKFNPIGSKLMWGTYYGGTVDDGGYQMALDDSNNVYVVGGAQSTTGIATPGAYQTVFGGYEDAFIAKFNSTGSKLFWGTYYGGTSFDVSTGIALDDSTNIYITGYTRSTSAIATPGAYQAIYGGGQFNVFVSKFNSTGSKLMWGTYYGGTGTDGSFGIALDSAANIFIAGQSSSYSVMATPGAYQTTCDTVHGDALLAEFSNKPAPITIFTENVTAPLCNGGTGSATITPWGGVSSYTYSWTPSGGTNATGTGLSAGTYTITVTDKANKSATASVTITQPALLKATIGTPTNILCNGGTSTMTAKASGGISPYIYLWTPSGETNATATGLKAGSYKITVTDSNGCTATASVVITQPTVVTATMGTPNNPLCNGGVGNVTVTAGGGISPYVYLWSPSGGTNATGTGLTAGLYMVTITDLNNCSVTASVAITQPSVLTATMGPPTNILCNGGTGSATVSAKGGTAPYVYSWSPSGGTNAMGTGLTAGTYVVTITDINSCTATASTIIAEPAILMATMGAPNNILCNGGTGSATVSASGGTAPYVYSWTPSGGSNAMGTGLTPGTYTVTVHDNNDCSATASVMITQPTAMVIIKDSVNVDGAGDCNGEASVNVNGGTAPYFYNWSPGGGTNDTINAKCAGQYCCTITDNNGCKQNVCITILNTTGISEVKGEGEMVKVYPNPSDGVFTFQSSVVSGQSSVEVYNILGEKIYSQLSTLNSPFSINLSNQPNGIYLYRVITETGNLIGEGKMVIQK